MWPNERTICTASANSANCAPDRILDRNQFIELSRHVRGRPTLTEFPTTKGAETKDRQRVTYLPQLRRFFGRPFAAIADAGGAGVGILLVFSLMVDPPAAAQPMVTGLWSGMALSAELALAGVWLGIAIGYHTDWPVSFCIAMLSALGYFAARGRCLTSRVATIAASGR